MVGVLIAPYARHTAYAVPNWTRTCSSHLSLRIPQTK